MQVAPKAPSAPEPPPIPFPLGVYPRVEPDVLYAFGLIEDVERDLEKAA